MYNWLGKTSVRFAVRYLGRRYQRQARIALGVGIAAAALAAYLASREVPEG